MKENEVQNVAEPEEIEVREVENKRGGRINQGMYTRFSSESHEVNEDRLLELQSIEKRKVESYPLEEEPEQWRHEKQRKKKKHHKSRDDDERRGSISRKHKHKHKKRSDRADKESERSLARYS